METYITICKIDNQWKFAVWLRQLKQGLCINLEGWDGKTDGRKVQSESEVSLRPHGPGSSVHGILQARVLEWVAISLFRVSSRPRDKPGSPTFWADTLPSEPPGKPKREGIYVYLWLAHVEV